MTANDLVLTFDAPIQAILQEFAGDVEEFKKVFKFAWTKLMNIDRFDGPVHNSCSKRKEQLTFLS